MRLSTAAVCALALMAGPAWSTNVTIDFSFDTNNFFGSGNPDGAAAGAQARTALLAAADFYSDILQDTLSGGSIPDRVDTSSNGGFFEWRIQFSHPGAGGDAILASGVTNAEDEYRIFAGGRSLGGDTLGIGGAGGFFFGPFDSNGQSLSTVSVTPQESALINTGNAAFAAGFIDRGETSGYSGWGGSLTFDSDSSTNWHYDHTTLPSFGETDFFSVALHEMGHALGFGTVSEWTSLVANGVFNGAASTSVFGGAPPISPGHWRNGLISKVLGTGVSQEVAFDPSLTQGTRKLVTTLDAAALVDIGWEVDLLVLPPGDYNGDFTVDAADYTIWRSTVGTPSVIGTYAEWAAGFTPRGGSAAENAAAVPEPASVTAALGGALFLRGGRRRRPAC